MKRLYKVFAGTLSVCLSVVMAYTFYLQNILPSDFKITEHDNIKINKYVDVVPSSTKSVDASASKIDAQPRNYDASLRFLGVFKIKDVNIQLVNQRYVVPCGTPFGIKMFTDGVMVVGVSNPNETPPANQGAVNAGIKVGDIILSYDGNKVYSNDDIKRITEHSNGKGITVVAKRQDKVFTTMLNPFVSTENSSYKAGMWVRDSSAGIGTMTYYDPATNNFAGLGHAVCDVDTGNLMPLYQGEIVKAAIVGINKGSKNSPGELKGVFVDGQTLGTLKINSAEGVYGKLQALPIYKTPIPLAQKHEVRKGDAIVLSTIDGERPMAYKAEITTINHSENSPTKNMIITITDQNLLRKTGG
ncbi:MAG: SpoIVB peptidase S55 domain-containing protein, partial [Oscillospiraceae bacterium]